MRQTSETMNEPTLAKTYDPKSIEASWYDTWLDSGHFACSPNSICVAPPFNPSSPNGPGTSRWPQGGRATYNGLFGVNYKKQKLLGGCKNPDI